MVTLLECLLGQSFPDLGSVNRFGRFECHLKVSAFNRQLEPGLLVLDEVQGDLEEDMWVKVQALE